MTTIFSQAAESRFPKWARWVVFLLVPTIPLLVIAARGGVGFDLVSFSRFIFFERTGFALVTVGIWLLVLPATHHNDKAWKVQVAFCFGLVILGGLVQLAL